ncbi:MAG: 3-dehydroquinate synthase [Acidobacteriota bacterium]
MIELQVRLGQRGYPIYVELGCLSQIGDVAARRRLGGHAALITDETVASLYAQSVIDSFHGAGIRADLHVVPAGERSKSIEWAGHLYTRLIQSGLHRDGFVVALGGGVVGDLAGFVSATYLRGVPMLQVPTSLLAQVDSSVGGKVGVNHAAEKNLIGAFHQPSLVCIDPSVLLTLPRREVWSGLGEVVKCALIEDAALFSRIEDTLDALAGLSDLAAIAKIIAACCEAKARIVEQDERERGLRRILNFGHTLAHAIEASTGLSRFRHGEAVVHGMRWACEVSVKRGLLWRSEFDRITGLLNRFPIPSLPLDLAAADLVEHMGVDKKRCACGLTLVLIEEIGKVRLVETEVSVEMIEEWLCDQREHRPVSL